MALDVNIFHSYTIEERMDIINLKGEFLTRIKSYGFWINLYVVGDIFVEVFYNAYSNTIEDIELLEPTDECLNMYAAYVDISDLGIYYA